MARRAARERPPISRRLRINGKRSQAGFTLLEIVCVLAIVALLAAISLPRLPIATSRPKLEAYAIEIAALLKADRNAALLRHGLIEARVDAPARTVSSGSSSRAVTLPGDVKFDALLPERCNGRPALSAISFIGTGLSCGGAIRLSRPGSILEVRVNWLTGGVEIVAQDIQ